MSTLDTYNVRLKDASNNTITNLSVIEAKGTRTHSTAAPTTSAASVLAANTSRKVATIYNNGSQTVYLGSSSGVTSSNGFPLLPGATVIDRYSTNAWFAITASGTGDLRIAEVV